MPQCNDLCDVCKHPDKVKKTIDQFKVLKKFSNLS